MTCLGLADKTLLKGPGDAAANAAVIAQMVAYRAQQVAAAQAKAVRQAAHGPFALAAARAAKPKRAKARKK
jgi:hypothetical protein